MDEIAERRTKQMEIENQELIEKLHNDAEKIREKESYVNKLRGENEKAERVIRDLARQSDLNQLELEKIKQEIEN